MSRRFVGTLPGLLTALAVAWTLTPALALAQTPAAPRTGSCAAGGCATGGCASCVSTTEGGRCGWQCCPHYHYCPEGPVRIHFGCGCAKPVCNPCDLPHFGHWQPCWTPWPYPPDWSHCKAPSPAASILLNPALAVQPGGLAERGPVEEAAPARRPTEGIRPGL